MDNMSFPFTIGHHESDRPLPITAEAVASAQASGYDVLTSPITTNYFHSRVLTLLSTAFAEASPSFDNVTNSYNASPIVVSPLAPEDTPLTPDDTTSQLVGIGASWIDLGSPDPIIADISRQVLQLELAYAAFCGLSYVVIPGPRIRGNNAGGNDIVQYARAIFDALAQGPFMTIYIWLPMIDHSENQKEQMGDLAAFARASFLDDDYMDPTQLDLFGTWQAWDIIRSICRYSTRLCVALSMPKLLPPTPIQSRWFSEPVRILIIGSSVFIRNPKGYPVLSKAHQAFIFRFVHSKQPAAWFLLSEVGPIPGSSVPGSANFNTTNFPSLAQASENQQLKDPTPHLSYMRNLQTKAPAKSAVDTFGAGYQDYLQAPLQPLTVNLESVTYEVFEKDPIKYEWYERAIARALHDWVEEGKPTSNPDGRVVVAVVGAGRGPLVSRALRASEAVGVEIDMWALEKNQNAFVLLRRYNETQWNRNVKLVKSDMRTWRGPSRAGNTDPVRKIYNLDHEEEEEAQNQTSTDQQTHSYTGSPETDATYLLATGSQAPTNYKIDILISELLGSFADNELSPECLDGVQHLLNPTHGISIPASYTAHITPIAAPKIHGEISLNMINTIPNAAEMPYVVMLNAIDFLSTEVLPQQPIDATPSQPIEPPSSPKPQTQPQSWSTIARTNHRQPTSPTSPQQQQQQSSLPPAQPTPIIKTTWSFSHPNPLLPSLSSPTTITQPNPTTTINSTTTNTHNNRHSIHTFPIPNRGTCHGIAGYFETVLYPGVELSTNPNTMPQKSEDMISWFPIYFPLKTPLHAPDNSEMTIQMWRQTDDRKVWYEWIVDVFIMVEVAAHHNTINNSINNGGAGSGMGKGKGKEKEKQRAPKMRRVRVGGSELHSSEKEGCLM